MTDRETGAREIAHSPMWGFTCGTPAARGNHCSQCNTMTALVMSYGDKRAAGEREKINAVLRKAWSEEVAERLIRETGKA
jgi:hypothetical protein